MNRSATPKRTGFTLVELMVVAAIVAILAAMALGGLVTARQSANRDRTRATIAKIHSVILPMYDEYKYRRVPINTRGMNPNAAALARLKALRDLMRLEMPERKTDVLSPSDTSNNTARGPVSGVPTPSLHEAYFAQMKGKTFPGNYSSAECLYLVVTIGGGEDARKLFQDSEIADTDKNGLMEFVDAWGKPIQWLRWAPGFNESDVQPNVSSDSEKDAACANDHDPLDTRKIDVLGADPDDYRRGWRLVPLIFSAGPDGEYGLAMDDSSATYVWTLEPDVPGNPPSVHYEAMWGKPATSNGDARFDNIHNHQLEAR